MLFLQPKALAVVGVPALLQIKKLIIDQVVHLSRENLNDEWSYHLRGAECRFESKVTGQVVEIIITRPEFGYKASLERECCLPGS